MNSSQFPGLSANLKVEIQDRFEGKYALFLTKVWIFYNNEPDTRSLINNIQILQDRVGVATLSVFFRYSGCEMMKKAFPENEINHFHENNICELKVTRPFNDDPNTSAIKSLLQVILDTQNFSEDSKSEMQGIISGL